MLVMLVAGWAWADPLPPAISTGGVQFRYEAPDASTVAVAGSFNHWNPTADVMRKDERGVWLLILPLSPGRHEYKYVVDGSWMAGENLVLVIRRDPEGQLHLPETPTPNTPYSSRIQFSGQYAALIGWREFREERSGYRLSTPTHHLDLDFTAGVTTTVVAFTRLEMDSSLVSGQNTVNATLARARLEWDLDPVAIQAWEHGRMFYFDDPLKLLRGEIFLRQDTLEFVDEQNPNRRFGLNQRGLVVTGRALGLEGRAFVTERKGSTEDTLGTRVRSRKGLLTVGGSAVAVRGEPWASDTNSDGWFPTPDATSTGPFVADSAVNSGATQPWYKGYLFREFFAGDGAVAMAPGLSLFGELGAGRAALRTSRWNEGRGRDSPLEKSWGLSEDLVGLIGLKGASGAWTAEVSYRRDQNDLGDLLQGGRVVSRVYAARVRYRAAPFWAGVETTLLERDLPGRYAVVRGSWYSPTLVRVYGDTQKEAAWLFAERGWWASPFVEWGGPPVRARAAARLWDLRPVENSGSLRTLRQEGLLEVEWNARSGWSLLGSGRAGRIAEGDALAWGNVSDVFWSGYAGVRRQIGKGVFLQVGWGVDPADIRLADEMDLREEFLSQAFARSRRQGSGPVQAARLAEQTLQDERRITLRAEIRF